MSQISTSRNKKEGPSFSTKPVIFFLFRALCNEPKTVAHEKFPFWKRIDNRFSLCGKLRGILAAIFFVFPLSTPSAFFFHPVRSRLKPQASVEKPLFCTHCVSRSLARCIDLVRKCRRNLMQLSFFFLFGFLVHFVRFRVLSSRQKCN